MSGGHTIQDRSLKKLKTYLATLIGLCLGSCSDLPDPAKRVSGPEIIELEKGKDYLLKFDDSDYSFTVGDDNFTVMRGDGVGDKFFSPFTVILEDGGLWYEIRSSDGTKVFAVQDFDGDGLGDRRMTFPIVRPPGSKAKLENITHNFELETDPSVRKLSTKRKSEQGSAQNPLPWP